MFRLDKIRLKYEANVCGDINKTPPMPRFELPKTTQIRISRSGVICMFREPLT